MLLAAAKMAATHGKIIVMGANGKLGRRIVQIALDKGLEVSAFVREKKKLAELFDEKTLAKYYLW